jgi:hypothetical protein
LNQFGLSLSLVWEILNSLVWGLAKSGLNQTKPNFPNTSHDITITQSVAGRILQSTTTEGMSDSTDPWTKGFFDNNSEAFVVDSLPDELQDIGLLDSQLGSDEEIKDWPKVLTVVYFYYSFTDKAIM